MVQPHPQRDNRLLLTSLGVGAVLLISLVVAGCMPRGPVVGSGEKTATANGTISGAVRTTSKLPLSGRLVTATEVTTGAKYDASTSTTGGYTIKLPVGRYRLDVELRDGESVAEGPSELTLSASDLDAARDFVIAAKARGGV
jgi:hypothetical protein